MESCIVLFKPRIHLFACTHPSVSNSLDCNDWLAYKHQFTALCSNTYGLWFLVLYKHHFPPCVSNMSRLWILVAHTHKYPALCLKHVWIMVPCRCARICLRLLWSNTWIVAPCCVQAPVSTRVSNTFFGSWSVYFISLRPFVSNTFDFRFLFVYTPAHTKMRTPELENSLHRVGLRFHC